MKEWGTAIVRVDPSGPAPMMREGPLRAFVLQQLYGRQPIVDPFCADCECFDLRNDIGRGGVDAADFILRVGATADGFFIDPPYSDEQSKRRYGVAQNVAALCSRVRKAISSEAQPGAVVVWLGWNSWGMLGAPGWERRAHAVFRSGWGTPDVHAVVDQLEVFRDYRRPQGCATNVEGDIHNASVTPPAAPRL